ncbi:hypothetical protein [Streptomyces sp. NPDC047070]|uniref:hypothetical protein n=1 Tax=Streptomyces sp. NPDC047070 TaxID=3154923 RepID=UPI003455D15E
MSASWEGIAHVLERETVSDAELALRLGCAPEFVGRVRTGLKLPAFSAAPFTPPDVPEMSQELLRFEEMSVVIHDGHRHWLDRRTEDGVPLFSARLTAGRVAFRLHYGRDPEGQVRAECEYPHCVEGLHLSDRPMRARDREAL